MLYIVPYIGACTEYCVFSCCVYCVLKEYTAGGEQIHFIPAVCRYKFTSRTWIACMLYC